jgi:hypothetical protein
MSRRALVLAVGALLVLVSAVLFFSWATEERPFRASVPQPPPLDRTSVLPVRGGQEACLSQVTVLARSETAAFRVGTRGRPPVPLATQLTGPGGYRTTARIAADWADNDLLTVALEPPRQSLHGRFCIRNLGRHTVDLYAADERARTISPQTVGGDARREQMQLSFGEQAPRSVADRRGVIQRGIEAFRPAVVGPWLLWPLLVLVVAGLPIGTVAALRGALREDDEREP